MSLEGEAGGKLLVAALDGAEVVVLLVEVGLGLEHVVELPLNFLLGVLTDVLADGEDLLKTRQISYLPLSDLNLVRSSRIESSSEGLL